MSSEHADPEYQLCELWLVSDPGQQPAHPGHPQAQAGYSL